MGIGAWLAYSITQLLSKLVMTQNPRIGASEIMMVNSIFQAAINTLVAYYLSLNPFKISWSDFKFCLYRTLFSYGN